MAQNSNPNPHTFSVDARTIIQLGRDSIKNPTTALLELVKNSYDADATVVEVQIHGDSIRIADNGTGMTRADLQSSWLRIGFSEKRNNKLTHGSRRKTGEKGIGRLSTDRLGKNLTLHTKSKKSTPVQLLVDWQHFDVDNTNLSDVPVKITTATDLDLPASAETGTEIIITDLRQQWLKADVEQIYSELTSLVSPFSKLKDFEILFTNDLVESLNGTVKSAYYDIAELSLQAKYVAKSNTIEYVITDKSVPQKVSRTKNSIAWNRLALSINKSGLGFDEEALSCGEVGLELLFFSRTMGNPLLKAKGLSIAGLRSFLDKNTGIKVYRDNISVKPFGYNNEPAGDWLSLAQRKERDPAGLRRPTYKVSSYQLVGAVSIGRDSNPQLRDGAAREGLVENSAFNDLRAFSLACVTLLERHRYETNKKLREAAEAQQPQAAKRTVVEEVETLSEDLENLQHNLEGLNDKLKDSTASQEVQQEIATVIKNAQEAKRRVDELLDNNRVLSGLATVGISAAVFGHETQTAITAFRSEVHAAQSSLRLRAGANVERALSQLDMSLGYAEQVSSWGAFAVTRVKKDKRTRTLASVDQIIEEVLAEIEGAFTAIKIEIGKDIDPVKARVFTMDIESVVLNLLTNAYAFCSRASIRKTRIELHRAKEDDVPGFEIIVADSGPGVDESFTDMIWEPLFTTKRDSSGREEGTGLGLSIVRSTVEDLGGSCGVAADQKLGGARFRIWLPSRE